MEKRSIPRSPSPACGGAAMRRLARAARRLSRRRRLIRCAKLPVEEGARRPSSVATAVAPSVCLFDPTSETDGGRERRRGNAASGRRLGSVAASDPRSH